MAAKIKNYFDTCKFLLLFPTIPPFILPILLILLILLIPLIPLIPSTPLIPLSNLHLSPDTAWDAAPQGSDDSPAPVDDAHVAMAVE